jgi:hypothetical protein
MTTGKPLSKELIQKIREEVLKGKTKYQVAKEMEINESVVRSHTRDLPSLKRGEPYIKGKAVDLLKQLLEVGYVHSTTENYLALQRLRRILPMIQQTRIDYKRVYYLSDKNKIALQVMITRNKSRIISYQELKSISKVFGVNLSREEKHDYARPRKNHIIPLIRKKEGGFLSSLKKNQVSLDDFHGKSGFLGRNQRHKGLKNQGFTRQATLRENEDSLAFFYIRRYCKRISLIFHMQDCFEKCFCDTFRGAYFAEFGLNGIG